VLQLLLHQRAGTQMERWLVIVLIEGLTKIQLMPQQ